MKKIFIIFWVIFFSIILMQESYTQDLNVVVHDYTLSDTLNADMAFYVSVTNISITDQTIFLVRTSNILPQDWTSSLCFDLCFASFVDSIASNPDFGSTPLAPNETREVSLHIFPVTNLGTGTVQIQIGTLRNPDERTTIDFTGNAVVTDVNDNNNLFSYSLNQNYPNPFNPSTNIVYSIPERGNVSIKLYDVLGNEIADLLNEEKEAGEYSLQFNTQNYELSSGVYFYTMRVNDFVQTRKLILEK